MVTRALTALACGLLCGWPLGAAGLEPQDLGERWRWRVFDRVEGLPSGAIWSIGHDRDDFLYAGTDRGLLRYNGFTWSTLESAEPLEGGPVTRIVESGGDVYAATRSEVWLVRYATELHRVLRGERVLIAAGPLSGLYVIDAGARAHHHLEKETQTRVDEGAPLPEGELFDYAIDDRRMHWLAAIDGLYRRDVRTRFRWQLDPDLGAELRDRPCRRLFLLKRQAVTRAPAGALPEAQAPTFELWALFGPRGTAGGAGGGSVLARREEAGWSVSPVDPSGPAIADLVYDGAGSTLAMAEDGRVFLAHDGGGWLPVPALGIGAVALSGGILDPHGYIWYRGGTAEVARFDGASRRWERYDRGLGLPSNNVLSLVESNDGSIWAGTDNGVYHYSPGGAGDPAAYHGAGGVAFKGVTGLAEDRTGKVWISSESFSGTFFFQDGSWHRFEPGERKTGADPGIAAHPIRRIVTDRGGDLWFLSTARATREEGGPPREPRSSGYLIYRYSASVYTQSTFRSLELPYGPASDLLQAQDKSFWIATDEGLVRWSTTSPEDLRLYTQRQGLRADRVWAVAEAADGAIWVSYDPSVASGVSRIRGDRVETFDERNGLSSPNAWSVATSTSPEGVEVWFGTDRGIIRFDGECWYNYPLASLDPQSSRVLPLVVARDAQSVLVGTIGQGIFRFRKDERRRPRITSLEWSRTPQNVVAFRWDGRDFKNETPPADLRFRTRIDDQPWTPFGPERSRNVHRLSPGDHTFYVELRDLDGNSNREKYERPFHLPPLPVLSTPLLWAALSGAAATLAVVSLAAVLLWSGRGRGWRRGRPGFYAAFPGAALLLDREGRIERLEGARAEALGVPPALAGELPGSHAALLPLFQTPAARGALERALQGEESTLEGAPLDPGGSRFALLRLFPVPRGFRKGSAGAPAGAVVLVEEVTASRKALEIRERARRLAALQDLAARIALELEEAAGGLPLDELRAALRRFAGGEEGPAEPLALPELLSGLSARARNGARPDPLLELPASVELDLMTQTGLWTVVGDRAAIRFALGEVLKNGVDAMPGGGRLRVRFRNRRLDGDPGELAPGPYVEVEVEDTGAGISAAELPRAFEPFFSTKARDRARGLGLSLAYGVIRRHRGDIRLASTPGAGTTVTLLLPADPGAEAAAT